jgi:hypothetical protein
VIGDVAKRSFSAGAGQLVLGHKRTGQMRAGADRESDHSRSGIPAGVLGPKGRVDARGGPLREVRRDVDRRARRIDPPRPAAAWSLSDVPETRHPTYELRLR